MISLVWDVDMGSGLLAHRVPFRNNAKRSQQWSSAVTRNTNRYEPNIIPVNIHLSLIIKISKCVVVWILSVHFWISKRHPNAFRWINLQPTQKTNMWHISGRHLGCLQNCHHIKPSPCSINGYDWPVCWTYVWRGRSPDAHARANQTGAHRFVWFQS